MSTKIDPDDWRPVDLADLEPNAWTALRRQGSTLVAAGPGSGKTEFLAQRAAYLLQTGLCPAPFRILAISFKVDAAENLARRVQARCTENESKRFVSLTFDAFTKSLVDRFATALPKTWRPTQPYDILVSKTRETDSFLESLLLNAPINFRHEIAALKGSNFESKVVGSVRLPSSRITAESGTDLAVSRWWDARLSSDVSNLSFICVNRLAELLTRTNPQIRRAILNTYPFIFVDEFQDTTYAQYDFLSSLLTGSDAQITAVGDDKQSIMAWAGAQSDVFSTFESDFDASRISLALNHRSSPGLVRIQQHVARAIDVSTIVTEARGVSEIDGDVAQIWRFPNPSTEAREVAEWLRRDMATRNNTPRDYALLVRQTADEFEEQFRPEFELRDLSLSNESRELGNIRLQTMLAEESTQIALAVLRLCVRLRAPEVWPLAVEALVRLRAVDPYDESATGQSQEELTCFIRDMRRRLQPTPSSDAAGEIADCVFAFLGVDAMRGVYGKYADGNRLAIAIGAFRMHLQANAETSDNWNTCVDEFEGRGAVPLMTVHGSKGLEYDTIIFVGLDDKSWWSHQPGGREGRSTVFVALSRAKQRVVFTYCERRARKKVADLYHLLTTAGVPEIDYS